MSELKKEIRIAISSDFLKSYSKISQDRQTRVRAFIEKFKTDPTSSSLNYEKVVNATDPNLYSLRVDQKYRAIVLKPQQGDVYMLLWVDNHNEAYQWAENRQFSIHPDTGALQMVDVVEHTAMPADELAQPDAQPRLFDAIKDKHLRKLGVPDALMALVRGLETDSQLEETSSQLPQEAYEGLFLLAAGYTLEEVVREQGRSAVPDVDTSDFATALSNPDSQRRFVLVNDDYGLQEMLAAPLEQWRVFLHPMQRKIIHMQAKGPVRVLGGAGTGKTVVALHRAKWLAEYSGTDKNQRILFTTFTKNLATDIAENLHSICNTHVLRNIEVTNIDGWVSQFLKQNGYNYRIVFGKELEELWQSALSQASSDLGLNDQFYRDEWEKIVQAQGISDPKSYVQAQRTGRGQRLSRKDRAKVWLVFEEYRALLNERRWKELANAVRDARHIIEQRGSVLPYSSVVVDEAQDMSPEVFRLLRKIVAPSDNDIFITGDAHQRIYGHKVVLSHCGIDVRGRSRKLRVNYRTTEQTKKWAVALLDGRPIDDLDGGFDDQKGYTSLVNGPLPEIKSYPDFAKECEGVAEQVNLLVQSGVLDSSICVAARTNDLISQYQGALESKGFKTYRIQRSSADNQKKQGVRMATLHRVKGLEFDFMFVVGVNDGIIPLSAAMAADNDFDKQENEIQERALLYVAGTRARQRLFVSSSGTPSLFLKKSQ